MVYSMVLHGTVYAYLIRSCSPHTSTHLHMPVDKRMRTNLLDRGIGAASSGSTRWRRAALRHLAHPSQPAGLYGPVPASLHLRSLAFFCSAFATKFSTRSVKIIVRRPGMSIVIYQWCKPAFSTNIEGPSQHILLGVFEGYQHLAAIENVCKTGPFSDLQYLCRR